MDGFAILALVLAIPVILVPVVLIWHMNIGGLRAAQKVRRLAQKQVKESVRG